MKDSVLEPEITWKTPAARHPLMQLADTVKLIDQDELGGGHMICNEWTCSVKVAVSQDLLRSVETPGGVCREFNPLSLE